MVDLTWLLFYLVGQMYLYVESRVAVIWWSRDVVAITLELGLVG